MLIFASAHLLSRLVHGLNFSSRSLSAMFNPVQKLSKKVKTQTRVCLLTQMTVSPLQKVFEELKTHQFFSAHNAEDDDMDAVFDEMDELDQRHLWKGYVYYTPSCVERIGLNEGKEVILQWGSNLEDIPENKAEIARLGQEIVEILQESKFGFAPKWNGSNKHGISLSLDTESIQFVLSLYAENERIQNQQDEEDRLLGLVP